MNFRPMHTRPTGRRPIKSPMTFMGKAILLTILYYGLLFSLVFWGIFTVYTWVEDKGGIKQIIIVTGKEVKDISRQIAED